MARLIDADALIDRVCTRIKNDLITRWLCGIIAETPTVEAAPVVRCAQCKYQRDLNRSDWYEGSFAEGVLWCLNQSEGVRPDDFCSYGERSEGE